MTVFFSFSNIFCMLKMFYLQNVIKTTSKTTTSLIEKAAVCTVSLSNCYCFFIYFIFFNEVRLPEIKLQGDGLTCLAVTLSQTGCCCKCVIFSYLFVHLNV